MGGTERSFLANGLVGPKKGLNWSKTKTIRSEMVVVLLGQKRV